MSDKTRSGLTQPGLTAAVSGALISLAAILYPDGTTDSIKQATAGLIAVASPFIVIFLMKYYHRMDIDTELIKLIGNYERDLRFQRTQLKDKSLPAGTRTMIEGRMQETMEKLATAHQDYSSGELKVRRPQ